MGAVVRDVNAIPEIVRELRFLQGNVAVAGLFADKVPAKTMIAAHVNEFGAVIKKTPKMRAWLGMMARKYGITLDPAKAKVQGAVVIPARSFVRSAIAKRHGDILKVAENMLAKLFSKQATGRDCLATVGLKAEQVIKNQINLVNEPPLHPLTVAMKGHDKPLVARGDMRGAIRHYVVARGS